MGLGRAGIRGWAMYSQATLHPQAVNVGGNGLEAVWKLGRVCNLLPLGVAGRRHPTIITIDVVVASSEEAKVYHRLGGAVQDGSIDRAAVEVPSLSRIRGGVGASGPYCPFASSKMRLH